METCCAPSPMVENRREKQVQPGKPANAPLSNRGIPSGLFEEKNHYGPF
ncbi:MAG: hypothetical protein QW491_05050 [Thermoproteota archaeon]